MRYIFALYVLLYIWSLDTDVDSNIITTKDLKSKIIEYNIKVQRLEEQITEVERRLNKLEGLK